MSAESDMEAVIEVGTSRQGAQLADALTSREPGVRVMARAVATGFPEAIQQWVQAERKRGEDPERVMRVLSLLFANIAGHCAGNLFRPEGFDMVERACTESFGRLRFFMDEMAELRRQHRERRP